MIGKVLEFLKDLLRFHKLKILVVLLSALMFIVMMFPYDDLGEVVTNLVAEQTANQVFLQFDKLGFRLVPTPALAIDNVVVESSLFPSMQASQLSVTPALSAFLIGRKGLNVDAEGFFDGSAEVNFKEGKSTEQGVENHVTLEIDSIDLGKVSEAASLPLKLQGKAAGEGALKIDSSFTNQPEGDFALQLKELRFPPGTLPTQMGPMTLPGMSWSSIQFKGRIVNSKLMIDSLSLGSNTDLFNGKVNGEMDVRFEPRGAGHVVPNFGSYTLTIDLNVDTRLEKELPFLIFLSQYKSPTTTGSRFRFQVSGQGFASPPRLSPASG